MTEELQSIDFNDARVYLIKFMETHNYAALKKLFDDLKEETLFELFEWVDKHQKESTINALIETFNTLEWFEVSVKLNTLKEQIKIVKHGKGNG